MTTRRAARWTVGALLLFGLAPAAVRALPIQIVYDDAADQGFLDPTLGPQRRAAFEAAVDQWAATLGGTVPVLIAADMLPLGGTGSAAVLASTGAVTLHRNFEGGQPATWYAAALANQIAGRDVNGPTLAEIATTFNADVDGPSALGSVQWYYGLDGQAGGDIDFLTIALHEIGHGLGFLDTVDATAGTFQLDDPSILERMLARPEIGALSALLPAERLAAIVAPGDLWWSGPAVVAFNGSPLPVYTPDPFQPGSSIAHWNTNPPGELMAPFYSGPNHDFGALLPALVDMGWTLAGAAPTPRSPPATPTDTRRPRLTPTPATPRATSETLYVTNFDDATVSVVDATTRRVVRTVAVDDGPLGIAASADGTRVYVAGFRAGTVSVLRTGDNRVVASLPVGDSPNAVAATPDGSFLAVTDTAADRVAIVAADTLEVVAQVPGGQQPSGVALDGAGRRAFVADFSGATVTVVDLDARRRRAIIPVQFATASEGLLGIAVAPATSRGYVTGFYTGGARPLSGGALVVGNAINPFGLGLLRPDAVVTDAAGSTAYFVGHTDSGAGKVSLVRMEDERLSEPFPSASFPKPWRSRPTSGCCTWPTPARTRCRSSTPRRAAWWAPCRWGMPRWVSWRSRCRRASASLPATRRPSPDARAHGHCDAPFDAVRRRL